MREAYVRVAHPWRPTWSPLFGLDRGEDQGRSGCRAELQGRERPEEV